MSFQVYGPLRPTSPLYQRRSSASSDSFAAGQYVSRGLGRACLGEANSYHIVYGSRQSGKTSLLFRIDSLLRNTTAQPCWVSFQRVPSTAAGTGIRFLVEQVSSDLEVPGSPSAIARQVAEGGRAFDTWLAEVARGRSVVLLLEEVGALTASDRHHLGNQLRGMFDSRHRLGLERVTVILFGGIELFDMATREVSPLRNVCTRTHLADLSLTSSEALLLEGLRDHAEPEVLAAEIPAIAQAVFREVEGHPYLTQRLGADAAAYARVHDGSLPCAEAVRELASAMRERERGRDGYFGHLYNSVAEYGLVTACERLLQSPPYSEALPEDGMMQLRLLGVAKQHRDRWVVRNPLLRDGLEQWLPSVTSTATTVSGTAVGVEPETDLAYRRDEAALLTAIRPLPCFRTREDREAFLISAGLAEFIDRCDLSGPPARAVPRLFDCLRSHGGSGANGCQALCLFLSHILEGDWVGLSDTQQLLGAYLSHYSPQAKAS